ncbi:hypothetical protein [Saccharopolyspora shandongensis]|uniref:hypothetical protein n=1 Tax=Saccharopolyspora shandongensis TaxID=418495 RepID=UPI0033BFDAEB
MLDASTDVLVLDRLESGEPLRGEFTPGDRWDLELALPDGRTLTHTYRTTGRN